MTPGLPLTVQVLAGGGVEGAFLVGSSAPRAPATAETVKAAKIQTRFEVIVTKS